MNTSNSSARKHLVSRRNLPSRINLRSIKSIKTPPFKKNILMILENPVGFLNGLPAVRYMYLGSLTLEVPPWNLEYQIDYLNKRGGFYRFKMILEGRSLSQWLPAVAKISIDTTSYWLPAVAKCICGLRPQSKSISVEGTTSSNLFEVVSSSLYINYHMLDSVMLDRMTRHPIDYYNVTSDFRFKGNSYGGVETSFFPETRSVWNGSSPRLNTSGRSTHIKNDDDAPAAHTELFLCNPWVGSGEGEV